MSREIRFMVMYETNQGEKREYFDFLSDAKDYARICGGATIWKQII